MKWSAMHDSHLQINVCEFIHRTLTSIYPKMLTIVFSEGAVGRLQLLCFSFVGRYFLDSCQ